VPVNSILESRDSSSRDPRLWSLAVSLTVVFVLDL
jgi:hypothetical protein